MKEPKRETDTRYEFTFEDWLHDKDDYWKWRRLSRRYYKLESECQAGFIRKSVVDKIRKFQEEAWDGIVEHYKKDYARQLQTLLLNNSDLEKKLNLRIKLEEVERDLFRERFDPWDEYRDGLKIKEFCSLRNSIIDGYKFFDKLGGREYTEIMSTIKKLGFNYISLTGLSIYTPVRLKINYDRYLLIMSMLDKIESMNPEKGLANTQKRPHYPISKNGRALFFWLAVQNGKLPTKDYREKRVIRPSLEKLIGETSFDDYTFNNMEIKGPLGINLNGIDELIPSKKFTYDHIEEAKKLYLMFFKEEPKTMKREK